MKISSMKFSVISIFVLLVLISVVGNYRESSANIHYELVEPYLSERETKIRECVKKTFNERKEFSLEVIENSCTSVYQHIFKSYEIQVWK